MLRPWALFCETPVCGNNKSARTSIPPEVNVRSTTAPDSHSVTASNTWLSRYLVVDYQGGGGRTSSKNHVKNSIPFLGMRKVHGDLQRLNKQVLIASKFAGVHWGSMLGTLVLRVEHPYIVRKSEKSLDMGEPTFHAEKTACY